MLISIIISQTNSILVTLNLAYSKAGFSFCVSPIRITDMDASVSVYVPDVSVFVRESWWLILACYSLNRPFLEYFLNFGFSHTTI